MQWLDGNCGGYEPDHTSEAIKKEGAADRIPIFIFKSGFWTDRRSDGKDCHAGKAVLLLCNPEDEEEAGMNFEEVLRQAKRGDRKAQEEIFMQYRKLLLKKSYVWGSADEDLFQELSGILLKCIRRFEV